MCETELEPIAITGMACRFPGANNLQEYWSLLTLGTCAIKEVPPARWDIKELFDPDPTLPGKMVSRWGGFLEAVDRFDCHAFGILPREALYMDPQQRLLLEVAWEALEDAGLPFSTIAGSQTGVCVGTSWSDYMRLLVRDWSRIDRYTLTGNTGSVVANRISYTFDLKGPSSAIDVGCSSSLSALYYACQSLWTGEADMMLAGGVHLLLSPDNTIIVSKAGLLSPDGQCRALDAQANGTVLGEGAGILVLKRLSTLAATDRVYALISGVATNHNGRNELIISPNEEAQASLLRRAYQKAGLEPADVDYVELHGIGLLRGDTAEVNALNEVLREGARKRARPCLVGSVKTNIGDLESAAGIASVIKVALALYHRTVPPTLHLQQVNSAVTAECSQIAVPTEATPWPDKEMVAVAGVTTLALAGANVHAVLASVPAEFTDDGEEHEAEAHVLPLSAHSPEALRTYAAAFQTFLTEAHAGNNSWRNICYTAAARRTHRPYRLSIVGTTLQEAAQALSAFERGESWQGLSYEAERNVEVKHTLLFAFPHQLCVHQSSLEAFIEHEPIAQAVLKQCIQRAEELLGSSLEEGMRQECSADGAGAPLNPFMTLALQIALVALWRSWGIVPDIVVAEGYGELAAAYAAGALTLEQAVQLLAYRESQEHPSIYNQIPLAWAEDFQGTAHCMIASSKMGVLPPETNLDWKHYKETITGTEQDIHNNLRYLCAQLPDDSLALVIEIGTRSEFTEALAEIVQQSKRAAVFLPCPGQERSIREMLLQNLGRLYAYGFEVNWSVLYTDRLRYRCVSLPGFPWQRERIWPDWLHPEEISSSPAAKRLLTGDEQTLTPAHGNELTGPLSATAYRALPLEDALAKLWAEVLGLEQVGAQESFFALGGHSLLATQLITRIRTVLQEEISLNALFNAPTPAGCAVWIRENCSQDDSAKTVPAEWPRVLSHPSKRYEPFPTTDVQQAYWIGRDLAFESTKVGNHGYIEVKADNIDVSRFNHAMCKLIQRHEMLRAIMLPDGHQQILETVPPFEALVVDLRGKGPEEVNDAVLHIRHEMDHQMLQVARWPALEVRILLFDEQRAQINLSLEVLFVDAWSTHLLIQEFIQLYNDPLVQLPALELSFRDYVLTEMELYGSELFQRAECYWRERLDSLPPAPELPLLQQGEESAQLRFIHREEHLDAQRWSHLKARAARVGLTPSGLLLAAFAEVLGTWSKNSCFSINLSIFHRLPLHPQVNDIVGDFTSLIVLAVDAASGQSFEQRARRLQEQLWSDLDHSLYNGVRVLRDLARLQGGVEKSLMPIVFTSLLIQDVANKYPAPWQETIYCVSQSPQVWLDHQALEAAGKLVLHWQSIDDLFPPGLMDAMFASYCALLYRLSEDENTWTACYLPILPEEQKELYRRMNLTEAPVTDDLLHTLFTAQVPLRQKQLAVVSPRRSLSYEELYRHATFLAHRLRRAGARPNRLVAVVMEKEWEQVVAVLAILQAGAAYLPIDPSLPKERQFYLLEHGEVEIVLTQSWIDQRTSWPESLTCICVDHKEAEPVAVPPLEPVQRPEDLAYVIYTSGSTGLPKGVMIDHRGAVNTILDMNRRFGVTGEDRVLALSALNFDLSVYDIFGLLAAGGTIVLPDENTARDPIVWLELLIKERITLWNSVPALLQMFVEYAEAHAEEMKQTRLRWIFLSGDWIPLMLPDAIRRLVPDASVVSLGGATEASIWSILYPIGEIDPAWRSIPYGRPMDNQEFWVLNERMEPCPLWVPGQLYIGGIGVARGYWRDEEKTRKSFIHHPVSGQYLYRTGDLGRYLPDGNIEFLGREDFQVKIRGYRIELGEIEAALSQHEAVRAAIVTTYNATELATNKLLVAYVIPGEETILAAEQSPVPSVSQQQQDMVQEYLAGTTLLDHVERVEFKLKQPALRHDLDHKQILLPVPEVDEAFLLPYRNRYSHRQFDQEMISFKQFCEFLNCLYQIELNGLFKYRYASTGGLYAVQTYFAIRPKRIEGVEGGIYYYHPKEHRLLLFTPDAAIDVAVHAAYNQPAFQNAAFSIFLIAHLDAIEPMYGDAAKDFCLIDAGYLGHHLMLSGSSCQLGLCPIGDLDFASIRHLFMLTEKQILVHSFVGGKALEQVINISSAEPAQPIESRASLLKRELMIFLRGKLPEYMVPTSLLFLEKFPLTPNGKIDRRALPRPEQELSEQEHVFVAPRTALEARLERIWSDILKREQISVYDNFFKLGGHSLLATRIMLRIRELFQVELPLRTLFHAPTIAELARIVEQAEVTAEAAHSLDALPQVVPDVLHRYDPFPLTDLQQAYWLGRTDLFALGNVSTHLYLEYESDQLDLERFERAWQQLIQRHDMLRAIIVQGSSQQVLEHVPAYHIEVQDLRAYDRERAQIHLEAIRQELSHQVVQADRWPLFEIRAARLDERRIRLFISVDALVYDYGSWRILYQELSQLYENSSIQLPPLELTFRDYVLAEASLEHTELYRRSLDYWLKRLPDLYPAPELPTVKQVTDLVQPRFVRREAHLSAEQWQHIKGQARQAGVTPSIVLLTVLAEVLAAWSKWGRFTINVPRMQRLPLHPQVNTIVGEFASFTLLEVDCSQRATFINRAKSLQGQLWDDLNHQYVSGVRILRELMRLRGGFSGTLMPIVFTSTLVWENMLEAEPADGPCLLDTLLREVHSITQTPQVWIDQQVFERAGALYFNWDSIDELFPDGLLDDMFAAYCNLLQRLMEPHVWHEEVPCLTPPAQLKQHEQINALQALVPDQCVQTLTEQQAALRPNQIAVIAPGRTLTYRELVQLSHRLAHRLHAAGVQIDELVAVVMEKGWEQVVATHGILAAGSAYVPLDPHLPQERLHTLLRQSKVRIVLTQSWLAKRLSWPEYIDVVSIDTVDLSNWPETALPLAQQPDSLVYVIYTSGSTGVPKGVMVAHRGIVNCIQQTNERFTVRSEDVVLGLTSLHHDMSVYDIFGVLAAGGTLVIPDAEGIKDPAYWAELLRRHQVSLWNSVPAMMEMLLEHLEVGAGDWDALLSLRVVWLGGDWIPLSVPKRLQQAVPGIQVVSVGGPTETTLWNIWYPITQIDPTWKSIPYGRPIANTQYHILNEAMQPCPVWVPGEMYCAGIGLARGYWGDEERTQAKFVRHPQTGVRLYRTGDWGRYLPDGTIEFLGREDAQVKIRGYRIELGEIEAILQQHEAIRTAVVTTYNESELVSNRQLVAYIVPVSGRTLLSGEVRTFLKARLPEHMLPSAFIMLEHMPLTANGKADRRNLPAPRRGESMDMGKEFVAPRTPVEEVVAQVWSNVFKLERVGVYDNFFELGGHSMIATRIIAQLHELFQGRFSIRTLLEKPTVAGMAEALHASEATPGSAEKIARLQLRINAMTEQEVQQALRIRE